MSRWGCLYPLESQHFPTDKTQAALAAKLVTCMPESRFIPGQDKVAK